MAAGRGSGRGGAGPQRKAGCRQMDGVSWGAQGVLSGAGAVVPSWGPSLCLCSVTRQAVRSLCVTRWLVQGYFVDGAGCRKQTCVSLSCDGEVRRRATGTGSAAGARGGELGTGRTRDTGSGGGPSGGVHGPLVSGSLLRPELRHVILRTPQSEGQTTAHLGGVGLTQEALSVGPAPTSRNGPPGVTTDTHTVV